MFTTLVYTIFLLIVLKFGIKLWKQFHRKDFVWDTNNRQYWAVVTGSTDGMGFEFARQLALKGYNLLMISRNEQKLEIKKQLILDECQNNVQVKTLAVDFKHLDIYEKIAKFLDGHDIFILVNNVGAGPNGFVKYFDEDSKFHEEIININIMSVVKMTEICLPSMIQKRRGLILNVSSFTGVHLIPGYGIYSATKAFVTSLSHSLFLECQSNNVLVFNLTPAQVDTKLLTFKSNTSQTPKQYVEAVLERINWTTPDSSGCTFHTIQQESLSFIRFIFGWQTIYKYIMYLALFSEKDKRLDFTPTYFFKFLKYVFSNEKTD